MSSTTYGEWENSRGILFENPLAGVKRKMLPLLAFATESPLEDAPKK